MARRRLRPFRVPPTLMLGVGAVALAGLGLLNLGILAAAVASPAPPHPLVLIFGLLLSLYLFGWATDTALWAVVEHAERHGMPSLAAKAAALRVPWVWNPRRRMRLALDAMIRARRAGHAEAAGRFAQRIWPALLSETDRVLFYANAAEALADAGNLRAARELLNDSGPLRLDSAVVAQAIDHADARLRIREGRFREAAALIDELLAREGLSARQQATYWRMRAHIAEAENDELAAELARQEADFLDPPRPPHGAGELPPHFETPQ